MTFISSFRGFIEFQTKQNFSEILFHIRSWCYFISCFTTIYLNRKITLQGVSISVSKRQKISKQRRRGLKIPTFLYHVQCWGRSVLPWTLIKTTSSVQNIWKRVNIYSWIQLYIWNEYTLYHRLSFILFLRFRGFFRVI